MNPWQGMVDRVEGLSRPRGLEALSLFRVLAGATFLLQLAQWAPERRFLFGPHGMIPQSWVCSSAPFFDGFCWSSQPAVFDLLYFASVGVVVLWVGGYRTVLTTPLVWLAARSFHDFNVYLTDGGDNLFQILLVYAMVAKVDGRGVCPRPGEGRPLFQGWAFLRGLIHNGALLAFRFQVCVVYFFAGIAKLGGQTWPSGTALYYALAGNEYVVGPLPPWLTQSTFLVVALTWATVVFQVGFPFLMMGTPVLRRGALVVAMAFHMGIAVTMGLVSFAGFMMAADVVLLSDDELRMARAAFLRFLSRVFRPVQRLQLFSRFE